jgi:hypothetical protein
MSHLGHTVVSLGTLFLALLTGSQISFHKASRLRGSGNKYKACGEHMNGHVLLHPP